MSGDASLAVPLRPPQRGQVQRGPGTIGPGGPLGSWPRYGPGLLALAALLVGAQEPLGLLLALFDLAVELPAGLVPGGLSCLLDALVRDVGMLPGELLGLILHLAEIRHCSSSFSSQISGTLITHGDPRHRG